MGAEKKPFQLSMKMQEEESRKTYQLRIEGKLALSWAKAMSQSLCLLTEAIVLIIDSAIVKHAMKTNTLDMHDPNGFHYLIHWSNTCGIGFSGFAMCEKKFNLWKIKW